MTSENHRALLPCETIAGAVERAGSFVVVSNYGTGGDPKARGRRTSDEPAFTVTGKVSRNRVVSPDGAELERFNLSEAGRLQTFPMDYPWSGKDVSQQIGNAIPPRLAAHVLASALGQELDAGFLDQMMNDPWTRTDAGEKPIRWTELEPSSAALPGNPSSTGNEDRELAAPRA